MPPMHHGAFGEGDHTLSFPQETQGGKLLPAGAVRPQIVCTASPMLNWGQL